MPGLIEGTYGANDGYRSVFDAFFTQLGNKQLRGLIIDVRGQFFTSFLSDVYTSLMKFKYQDGRIHEGIGFRLISK